MSLKLNKYSLMKNNLKLILNTMIPGDSYMPCFTKAVKIETIIKSKIVSILASNIFNVLIYSLAKREKEKIMNTK